MKRASLLTVASAVALAWATIGASLEPEVPEVPPAALAVEIDEPSAEPGIDSNAPPAKAIEPARITLPAPLAEVVRLAESGMSEDVILAYVQKSPAIQPLSADQILYLRDLGISSTVLTALIEHRPAVPPAAEPVPAPTVPQYPPATEAQTAEAPLTPPGPAAVEQSYFYSSLAPYGSWLELPGYGWCWRPTVSVVSRGWRPYCDSGYWSWSDCGWYWNSYYSWGWAPFHYGRWCEYPRYGWVWCPGRTWSPAWVCWRQSGNHCGWAPLPPGSRFTAGIGWTHRGARVGADFGFGLKASAFTFVGLNHFTDRHASRHRLQGDEAQTAFRETRVNNDFAAGPNNRIINRGIDPQRVQAATRQPVRSVPVAELERSRRTSAPPTFGNPRASAPMASRAQPLVRAPRGSAPASQTPASQAYTRQSPVRQPSGSIASPRSNSGLAPMPERSAPRIAIPRSTQPAPRAAYSRPSPAATMPRQAPAFGTPQSRPQMSVPRQAPSFSAPHSQPRASAPPPRAAYSAPQPQSRTSGSRPSNLESWGGHRR